MTAQIGAGRPLSPASEAEVAHVELTARRHEADAFTVAARFVIRELEAVLLRPQYEYPVEALELTARLRGMNDRYARRWDDAA